MTPGETAYLDSDFSFYACIPDCLDKSGIGNLTETSSPRAVLPIPFVRNFMDIITERLNPPSFT